MTVVTLTLTGPVAFAATNSNWGNRLFRGVAARGADREGSPVMPSFFESDPQGDQLSPLQGQLWVPWSKSTFPKQLR